MMQNLCELPTPSMVLPAKKISSPPPSNDNVFRAEDISGDQLAPTPAKNLDSPLVGAIGGVVDTSQRRKRLRRKKSTNLDALRREQTTPLPTLNFLAMRNDAISEVQHRQQQQPPQVWSQQFTSAILRELQTSVQVNEQRVSTEHANNPLFPELVRAKLPTAAMAPSSLCAADALAIDTYLLCGTPLVVALVVGTAAYLTSSIAAAACCRACRTTSWPPRSKRWRCSCSAMGTFSQRPR